MGLLNNLLVRIKGDSTHLDGTLKKTESSVSSWAKKILGFIGIAFGVTAIISFTKECMKLAAAAEGIKKGFEQIATPGLLNDLRKATRGTVNDIQLMSRAVQASNFQIPLDQLASLLEFASARAIQTGQSVDYLVDSIVLGIGRKSPLILDNLGISAVRLREILKGAGTDVSTVADVAAAVGKIANEELAKMGGMAQTTAIKYAQLEVSLHNLKEAWGEFINTNKGIGAVIKWLGDEFTIFADKDLNFWQKIIWSPNEYAEWKKQKADVEHFFGFLQDKGAFTGAQEFPSFAKPKGGLLEEIADKSTVKSVSDLVAEIKKAAEESERMAKAWEIIHEEISGSKGGPKAVPTGQITIPQLGPTPGAADILSPGPKMPDAEDYTAEWENTWNDAIKGVTDFMSEAFIDVFAKIGEGSFADFGKNLLTSFGNLLANLGKMLVSLGTTMLLALTLLKAPTIPTAIAAIAAGAAAMAIGGLIMGAAKAGEKTITAGATSASANYNNMPQQTNLNINLRGSISGKDIALSLRRQKG